MAFTGFTKDTIAFFAELEQNNDKIWFEQNRKRFEDHVLAVSQLFVIELGEKLRVFAPQINAIPKSDKSIFRIHRDVRFSRDKSPYKTHLALLFWEGSGKKMESSGLYFHLDPRRLFLAAGMYTFTPAQLSMYRDAVVDDKKGKKLESIITRIQSKGNYELGWKKYKRVPRNYSKEHPRAELLLHGGIGFSIDNPIPDEIFTPAAINYCFKIYKELSPLHRWLMDTIVTS